MKKNYFLFLVLLLISTIINAQIVNIPDANFKVKLLAANIDNEIAYSDCGRLTPVKIDSNNNGEIEISEALEIMELNISGATISSIIGISAFANLSNLNCSNNLLNEVDISSISGLVSLNLDNNPYLTSINVKNENIRFLDPSDSFSTKLTFRPEIPGPCGINGVSILNCSNLQSICIGDSFHSELTSYLNYYNITGIVYSCTTLENSDFNFTDYITVYPNPVKERLYVNSTKEIEIKGITIYNGQGKLITSISNPNDFSAVDVSHLATGNYILKINTDKGNATTKFVKNN